MLRSFTISTKQNFNKALKHNMYFTVLRNFSKLFTKQHEWVSVEKEEATIGISDYAQTELGEIVHVDLPKVGDKFKKGDSLGAVESVKTAADFYTPIEGSVQEVNDKLQKTPNLLNSHAQSQGWIVKLKVEEAHAKTDLANLMNEEEYQKYIHDLKK